MQCCHRLTQAMSNSWNGSFATQSGTFGSRNKGPVLKRLQSRMSSRLLLRPNRRPSLPRLCVCCRPHQQPRRLQSRMSQKRAAKKEVKLSYHDADVYIVNNWISLKWQLYMFLNQLQPSGKCHNLRVAGRMVWP